MGFWNTREPPYTLLDTQTVLWMITTDGRRVSPAARERITTPGIELYVSHATGWEVAVKHGIGKLSLPEDPEVFFNRQMAANRLRWLPASVTSMFAAGRLPLHHKDPFDRLIVAQCLRFDLPLVSSDEQLDAYGIRRIW